MGMANLLKRGNPGRVLGRCAKLAKTIGDSSRCKCDEMHVSFVSLAKSYCSRDELKSEVPSRSHMPVQRDDSGQGDRVSSSTSNDRQNLSRVRCTRELKIGRLK